jgi:MYXO-CTERM domain-containing protein
MDAMNRIICSIALTLMLLSASAHAGVQEFTDKDEWIDAVGAFTTIDFTGFEAGTVITDQYADLGILFTDGDDWIHNTCGFLNDCWGLAGGDGKDHITLVFDAGEAYIGVDFPGDLQIDLYSRGRLIHSSVFIAGGHGNFGGVVSSVLFDSVVLSDPVFGFVAIDDLHFGVPAPGTLALLALGALTQRRRRREIGP